jgi:hypothetical protein
MSPHATAVVKGVPCDQAPLRGPETCEASAPVGVLLEALGRKRIAMPEIRGRCTKNGPFDRRRKSPRDAFRGKRHTVAFPCALSAHMRHARRRHRFAEVNHASDANHRAAGNASECVRSAGPERRRDSSTVGDTSPRDAFPASPSLVRGSKPASPSRGSTVR